MNIAAFSIKRPVFITSIVVLMLITGWVSLKRLGVDLFPDVNIPFITITTGYTGAGPEEIETLISKPIENEVSSISGLKRVTSFNQEGVSRVMCEFYLATDIKDAEQQIRNKVGRARRELPQDIDEPLIQRFDPSDQPIIRLSLTADLPPEKLYDLADLRIKTKLEQVPNVGVVRITGGVRREIQLEVDRKSLNANYISALAIANNLKSYGVNVPIGKYEKQEKELSYRTLGRFETLKQVENTVVSFGGDAGSALLLKKVAKVRDGTEDPKNIATLYAPENPGAKDEKGKPLPPQKLERKSKPALFLDVYKQSNSNTVQVADAAMLQMLKINELIKDEPGKPRLVLVRDGSHWIKVNVEDVGVAIVLGILLAVLVVYFFLGNMRSTVITGLALPNSILGAFMLMLAMGFTINIITLLALSLSIGLLVDDAIVVRENIFRKMEEGEHPVKAAETGTNEVLLAVIATTATVIAVFLPVGFLGGMVGQFLRQLGFTVVFAMIISLFDAITMAPMLSAYFGGKASEKKNFLIRGFDVVQAFMDRWYERIMVWTIRRPGMTLGITLLLLIVNCGSLKFVKNTFMPPNTQPEFMVTVELPPGSSLEGTKKALQEIEKRIKDLPEINLLATVVGDENGVANVGSISVQLVGQQHRTRQTGAVKDHVRTLVKDLTYAKPSVNDYSPVGGGLQYPFNLNLLGDNLEVLDAYSQKVMEKMKGGKDLIDISSNFQTGKPEFQIKLDPEKLEKVAVAPGQAGQELRYHIAGGVVGKLYEKGEEYDIRLRLREDQRDLKSAYNSTYVPNIQGRLIPLSVIAKGENKLGPARINRQDRSRVITINANIAPTGALQPGVDMVKKILETEKPPEGVRYIFWGQAEDFRELQQNISLAFGLALLFIYLVLASLYESFITPVTILFAIPPAISGAFLSLAVMNETLNIFSMIGIIMLMGLVTKNSILLVDYALQGVKAGLSRNDAIFKAGQARLRPILMTSFAMIAGTLPIALGFGEANKQRTAMGVAIIGGLIISTVITLFVVPAIFGFLDRFREFIESRFRPEYDMSLVGTDTHTGEHFVKEAEQPQPPVIPTSGSSEEVSSQKSKPRKRPLKER